jgi:nucleoside-diphosphate-sugar epimerase
MSPRPETILITGASGLIGACLCRAFHRGYDVAALDVKPPVEKLAGVDFVETDLTSDHSVQQALRTVGERHGERLASVIHLAAHYDFSGAPSALYRDLTVEGTRRLLRGLRERTFTVEQFIFSSTLLAMQPTEPGREISESSPREGKWAYPESKIQAERVIHDERGHLHAVILRIAGVYDEKCHSLPLSQQIARIYEKRLKSYVFPGDATHGQALIHLDDLTSCFRRCVEVRDRLPPEDVFLVAEPVVLSYAELQEELGELIHGTEWPAIRIPKALAKAGAWMEQKLAGEDDQPFIQPWMIDLADDHYAASIRHANVRLGWEPSHRLRDTLPLMIGFLKQDPAGFYEENGLALPESLVRS